MTAQVNEWTLHEYLNQIIAVRLPRCCRNQKSAELSGFRVGRLSSHHWSFLTLFREAFGLPHGEVRDGQRTRERTRTFLFQGRPGIAARQRV